jgi:plastocyanin
VKSTHSRRALAVSAVALGLVILGMTSGAAAGAAKPATHTVTIEGTAFSPADLTVAAGDTIVWVNKDILAHTATARNGAFDSKVIQPGQRWKYVVKRRGDFAYTCSFHPMDAILKVQ